MSRPVIQLEQFEGVPCSEQLSKQLDCIKSETHVSQEGDTFCIEELVHRDSPEPPRTHCEIEVPCDVISITSSWLQDADESARTRRENIRTTDFGPLNILAIRVVIH